MKHKQRGITAIGFVMLAALAVILGFAALRLVPIYLEQMKIAQVVSDLKSEFDGQNPSLNNITRSLKKRLDVESVSVAKLQDFEVTKTEVGYEVAVFYEDRTPYIANVFLVVEFENVVEIRR